MEWLIVFVVCAAIVIYMLETAPLGYEDETGFHYGKDPKDEIK